MMMRFLALTLLVIAATACNKTDASATPPPASDPAAKPADPKPADAAPAADATAAAKEIFSTRCLPCHGAGGAGDGPASAGLTPKPAAFTTAEWQASVTDEHIEKVIAYGGMAVGKSAAMPPNPDLDGKPVIPALRSLIRSFKP